MVVECTWHFDDKSHQFSFARKRNHSVTIYCVPWHCVPLGPGLLVNSGLIVSQSCSVFRVDNTRYIGIQLDSNLLFNYHKTLELIVPSTLASNQTAISHLNVK